MIITVTLAQGAVRMARRKVIVKHLAAIENFGSMDILCSDKTGTLTTGEMRLHACVDPLGRPADRAAVPRLPQQRVRDGHQEPAGRGDPGARGSPTSTAYRKLDEVPFDFERRRVSVVVGGERSPAPHRQRCAGVDPRPLCARTRPTAEPAPLDAAARSTCRTTATELSRQGFRLLAVASREVPPQAAYGRGGRARPDLAGFTGLLRPSDARGGGGAAAHSDATAWP